MTAQVHVHFTLPTSPTSSKSRSSSVFSNESFATASSSPSLSTPPDHYQYARLPAAPRAIRLPLKLPNSPVAFEEVDVTALVLDDDMADIPTGYIVDKLRSMGESWSGLMEERPGADFDLVLKARSYSLHRPRRACTSPLDHPSQSTWYARCRPSERMPRHTSSPSPRPIRLALSSSPSTDYSGPPDLPPSLSSLPTLDTSDRTSAFPRASLPRQRTTKPPSPSSDFTSPRPSPSPSYTPGSTCRPLEPSCRPSYLPHRRRTKTKIFRLSPRRSSSPASPSSTCSGKM